MVGLGRDICCYYNRLFQEMIPVFHCNKYLRTADNINDTPAKSGKLILVRRFGLRYGAVLMQLLYVFLRVLHLPVSAEADADDEGEGACDEDAGGKEQDSEVIANVGEGAACAGAAVVLAVAAICATSAAAAWRGEVRAVAEGVCFDGFVERVAIAEINRNIDKTVSVGRNFHGNSVAVYDRDVCSGNAADGYFGGGGGEGGVAGERDGCRNGRIYCCAISELTMLGTPVARPLALIYCCAISELTMLIISPCIHCAV